MPGVIHKLLMHSIEEAARLNLERVVACISVAWSVFAFAGRINMHLALDAVSGSIILERDEQLEVAKSTPPIH
jgi:hypothetical protein